ncbi:MAG: hypothetical protein L0Y58_26135 [Verrucomicrobia subdivision 3 bacterium]|nr:hypothetical protein [Limisphaerales bacterium]
MNPTFHRNERRLDTARLLPVITVLALLACLFGTGCACYRKGKSSGPAAPQVTILNESFEALKREFNADASKPRVLALFSPTCGGCIYGAKALRPARPDDPVPDEITHAFWCACHGGQRQSAEYLLARGADLNWIGYDGLTPIDAARRSEAGALVEWLASRDAKSAKDFK